jgi:hypothetical protein
MSAEDNFVQESHRSTIQFAIEAIRALLVVNGGAVVAILTFAGNARTGGAVIDFPLLLSSLRLFGVGLALAVLCAGLAYVAQALFTAWATDLGPLSRWPA